MFEARFDAGQIARLERALGENKKRLPKEMAIAVNATAKKVVGYIAKEIGKELNATQKNIKKQLSILGKATPGGLNTTVRLQYSKRIPLRDYGARQVAKGTTYKISKTKGRKLATGAFQGPRPGAVLVQWKGRVFQRDGKDRLPITQKFGPSPWGVYVINKHGKKTKKDASDELKKQMERRISFIKFKNKNKI